MWLFTFATMIVAICAYYGKVSPIVAGILAIVSMFFCEVGVMEHEIKTQGNNKFGSSYMDGLAISMILISVLMAFTNLWHVLFWIIIVLAAGYFGAKLFMKSQFGSADTASTKAQA